MKNVDLKPCPFCGGEAELHTELIFTGINYESKKVYVVYCQNTKCLIGFSECGHKVYIGTDDKELLKEEADLQRYCFHCGAKMDGKEN